ncbi:MAG: transposase [Usitatibacteraceae bacterium]
MRHAEVGKCAQFESASPFHIRRGAYRDDEGGEQVFVATPAIEKKAADRLLARIVAQLLKMLRRRGIINAEEWISPEENTPDAQLMFEAMRLPVARTHQSSLHSSSASVLCGFSLHCATRASAHDQAARLRLFRYVLRPAIATDKLAFDGKTVTFTMKRTFSSGLSILRFTPDAFIRRIAWLVPRPRQHEITYCGLFASNSKYRAKVVRVATHRKRKKNHDAHDATAPTSTMRWQELLKRTFACDLQKCDLCGGSVRIIATITERSVIDKILTHLGLAATHGNPAAARAPPDVVRLCPAT